MRMATLPLMFSSVRIDLNKRDWATVVMSNVCNDTFEHIKELELNISFRNKTDELNASELRLQASNSDAGCAFLKGLPFLSILKITLDINNLNDRSCRRECLRKPAWYFVNLLCRLPLQATNFNLHFRNIFGLSWDGDIWGELAQPFRHYLGASVTIDDWEGVDNDTISGMAIASAFSPSWVSQLHLSTEEHSGLRAAAGFANLTHLTVSADDSSDWVPNLWECLRNLPACLAFLSIYDIDSDISEVVLDAPILLPSLATLKFTNGYADYINQFCTSIQMPLLRNFNATIIVDLPGDLEWIDQLLSVDRTLRNQCPRRRYNLKIEDTNNLWRQDIKRLASQASQDPTFANAISFSLGARSRRDEGDDINEAGGEELRASTQNNPLADLQCIPEVCRPALKELEYSIEADCFSDYADIGKYYFGNLASLALNVAYDTKYPDLQAHRFLSMIVMPKLESLKIWLNGHKRVEPDERLCMLLVPSISRWQSLEELSLYIEVSEERLLKTGGFNALQSTCEANDVSLIIFGVLDDGSDD
jgi:hypothetical protein